MRTGTTICPRGRASLLLAFILLPPGIVRAEPSMLGQTGLVNMPDARLEDDGEFRLGLSNVDPYYTAWSSIAILPRLEVSARYTTINNVSVFSDGENIGDFRDKAFDAKLLLFRERRYVPQLALGTQDFHGTQLFKADYAALNKRIGDLDLTLGYGDDRIDGWFGGVRYRPGWARNLGFVVEYDANAYASDYQAALSGAAERDGGATYAVEFRYGWLGTQISWQDGEIGTNAYVTIPLMKQEFIPKIDEPAPARVDVPQVPLEEWRGDAQHVAALEDALTREGFQNIIVTLDGKAITARLTHPRISSTARAVSRAARVLVLAGPGDLESVAIVYTENDLPVVTYRFADVPMLRDYYAGTVAWEQVEAGVEVVHADTALDGMATDTRAGETGAGESLTLIDQGGGRYDQHEFSFYPLNLRFLFNDLDRPFRYEVFSLLAYRKHLATGVFFSAVGKLRYYEDISDVTVESDSELPHVRSDIAEYKQGDALRLDSILLNKYFDLPGRMYGRLSAGYYEEMYAGAGGQLLYLSRTADWAVDLMVDGVRQRDPDTSFALRDYSVVTALVSGHYRWPDYGVTATARVGQFLARDDGIRFELKRRFGSGVEVGGWYTVTNERDITGPGSPDDPYHDKGIFLTIPLSSMLTMDTQETGQVALSPWARDVGQMVVSPDDLYRLVEHGSVLRENGFLPVK